MRERVLSVPSVSRKSQTEEKSSKTSGQRKIVKREA
jgi:hypothetical protein